MSGKAVRVAVRVRLFNKREKAMAAEMGRDILGVDMSGTSVDIWGLDDFDDFGQPDPEKMLRKTFDYALWSHCVKCDGCPNRPDRPHIDQQALYNNIGQSLFDDFWGPEGTGDGGFECCLFAYGQSGAGKSFSMTGAGPKCPESLQGMIPKLSKACFNQVDKMQIPGKREFTVKCSMTEIYLDKVYDLLLPKSEMKKSRKERERKIMMGKPRDINHVLVKNTSDVADVLIMGFGNQTKAPTGLNPDSSRGHTIFTFEVTIQIIGVKNNRPFRHPPMEKSVLLVDLAGSEKSDKVSSITAPELTEIYMKKYWVKENYTHDPVWEGPLAYENLTPEKRIEMLEANKHHVPRIDEKDLAKYKSERAEEGLSINGSLSMLGKIVGEVGKVSGIDDPKLRAKKMKQVSWRSNKLTWLLQSALQGKCKTIMIAAISPSATENPETKNTMDYANSISKIKSTAKAQKRTLTTEEKMKLEMEELKKQLEAFKASGAAPVAGGGAGMTEEEKKELEEERERARKEAEEMAEELARAKEYAASLQEGSEAYKKREAEVAAREAQLQEEFDKRNAMKARPHLLLLTENPMTSGMFLSAIPAEGELVAGQGDEAETGLALRGTGVQPKHCTFSDADGKYTCTPTPGSQVFINGEACEGPTTIVHNDRLRLATQNFFRFISPVELKNMTPDQIEADDEKYTFDFVKQESMKSLLAEFEQEDLQKQERDRKLQEELKQREDDLKAQQLKFQQENEEAKKKYEEELAAMQERIKAEMASGNNAREAQLRAEMEAQNKALQDKMLQAEQAMKAKQDQESAYAKVLKDQHDAEEAAVESFKARLQMDLLACLPAVADANSWATQLQIPVRYECKVVMKKTDTGANVPITIVQLEDKNTKQIQVWSVDAFTIKYKELNDQFESWKGKAPGSFEIPWDSPFKVNIHAEQSIGTATVFLQYIFFNMNMNETFNIISGATGTVAGKITLGIAPIWHGEDQVNAVDGIDCDPAEDLHGVPDLSYLDLAIELEKCSDLPPEFASDVKIRFKLPPWMICCKLPEGFDTDRACTQEEYNQFKKRGLTIESVVLPHNVDVLNPNPEIDFSCTVRIFGEVKPGSKSGSLPQLPVSYRVREWFKSANLILEVVGEPPNLDLDAKSHAATFANKGGAKKGKVGGAGPNKIGATIQRLHNATKASNKTVAKVLADKKNLEAEVSKLLNDRNEAKAAVDELEAELSNMEGALVVSQKKGAFSSDELEEAKRRAKKAELREQERARELQVTQRELAGLRQQANMTTPEIVKQLQQQLAAAQAQAAKDRAALNKKSSACTVQ